MKVSFDHYRNYIEITETKTWCYRSNFSELCVLGGGPRLQRYVTQGVQAFECYGALRWGWGGQNRKFLRHVFFERPLIPF